MVDNNNDASCDVKIEFDEDEIVDPANVVYPPLEVRNIIDKTVPYVSRNGRKFEAVLQKAQQGNKRFDFLDKNHVFHEFYTYQLQIYNDPKLAEKWRAREQEMEDSQRQLLGKDGKKKHHHSNDNENNNSNSENNNDNDNNDNESNNNNNNKNKSENDNNNKNESKIKTRKAKVKVVELSLKQKIMQELTLAKHAKDEYIMPMGEPKYIIDWPRDITGYEMDVMKLTAQFAAIIGPTFMRTLRNEEGGNSETFGFIEHFDPRIHIFNTLKSSYQDIIANFNDYRRNINNNNNTNNNITNSNNNNGNNNNTNESNDFVSEFKRLHLNRDKLYYRAVGTAEYTRRLHNSETRNEETNGESEEYDGNDKEMALIDWTDFVVLENIDFDENDVNLVPPGHNIHEINRILATAEDLSHMNKSSNENEKDNENINNETTNADASNKPKEGGVNEMNSSNRDKLGLGIGGGELENGSDEEEESDAMEMSESEDDDINMDNDSEEEDNDIRLNNNNNNNKMKNVRGRKEEELPKGIIGHTELDVVPQLREGDGEIDHDLELRRQLDKLLVESRTEQMQTQQCPICGENINVLELSQHIKIELLDPQWKEQKEMLKSRMAQTQLAADSQIAANIVRFEKQRKKQYGSDNDDNEDDSNDNDDNNNNNNDGRPDLKKFHQLTIPWDGHKGFSEEQARSIRKMQDKLNEQRDRELRKIEIEKEKQRQEEIEKNSLMPKRLPSHLPPPIEKKEPIDFQHAPPAKKQKLNDGRSQPSS